MRHYQSYSGDPYWITCRYNGKCTKCGTPILKGQQAFKYKDGGLHGESCGCGEAAERDFASCAADEAFMSGGY